MPIFLLGLILFIASPFLWIAIALKSKILAWIGVGVAVVYAGFFLLNAFSEFLGEFSAGLVGPEIEERLQGFWKQTGPERTLVRFWSFPVSEPEFKIWVNGSGLEIFFSQGMLWLATDASLKSLFRSISEMPRSDIRLQNKRHALSLRLDRWKGSQSTFRHWFLSFWLYPLERLLKIAKL